MKKIYLPLLCTAAFMGVNAQNARTEIVQNLEDVVVTGSRDSIGMSHLPMTVTIVGREKLTENNRQSLLPTLMEQVPGLMVTSRGVMGYGVSGGGSGGMMLRGISSGIGQVMVLVDGHPQYQGIYGHSIADSYQTMMAERVEVLRGPASLLYGSNAMGGVVNIVTRGMKSDGVRTNLNLGAGSYGTVQADFSNQVRSGKFSSTVAAQYSRSDNHRKNMGFEQFGGYVKLNYDLNDNWNIYADADVTHFNASQPGPESAPILEADQWITRGVAEIAVENHYDRMSGALSVYDNFGRHKINDGYDPTKRGPQANFFRSQDALRGVSLYENFRLFEGNRITAGLDYQSIYGHAWYTDRTTGDEAVNGPKQSGEETNTEIAGYIDVRQDILSWLTVDAGIRVDNHSITGTELIPQAGIVVRPIDEGHLRLMAGKGFRNPTMKEMYLYPPSNTDLKPERLWNYEISWKHALPSLGLSYGLNLFYIKGDNIIMTVPTGGTPPMKNMNSGEIENKGVEVEAAWRVNENLSLNCNYSYLDMKNPLAGAPTNKIYLGGNYSIGDFSIAAGVQQVCGLYTVNNSDENRQDFTLLNATCSYKVNDMVKVWVRGDNMLNQSYYINTGYPMPGATAMAGVNLSF